MKLERNLELYGPQHQGLLAAAALEGVDVEPAVAAIRYIGFGETKHGYGPACILDMAGTEYVAEPHITWFPWTTPSQRIAHFKWAMDWMSKSQEILFTVQKDQISFFEHFVKKGMLRKVGYLDNMPIVEEVHMYQHKRGRK